MHVSAQKLLQLNSTQDFKISLLNASESPFYFLSRADWDNLKHIQSLTDPYYGEMKHLNIIKLTGASRKQLGKVLERNPHSIHRDSIIARYLKIYKQT